MLCENKSTDEDTKKSLKKRKSTAFDGLIQEMFGLDAPVTVFSLYRMLVFEAKKHGHELLLPALANVETKDQVLR